MHVEPLSTLGSTCELVVVISFFLSPPSSSAERACVRACACIPSLWAAAAAAEAEDKKQADDPRKELTPRYLELPEALNI